MKKIKCKCGTELFECDEIRYDTDNGEYMGNPVLDGHDGPRPDKYFRNPKKGFANADMNAGMDLATGEIIVLLTNDVFVKPGWLEALVDCFDIPDCGTASLGTSDHNETAQNIITEGIWCPLMAVVNKSDFRFDAETFPSYWGDTDFMMRIYEDGWRSYRNHRVICDHLGRATNTADHVQGKQEAIDAAHERFTERHGNSHLFIYRAFQNGLIL